MKRYKIFHRTCYKFSGQVQLGSHFLRLRPRESHELRIESSKLKIMPEAKLRWYRDVESNSVAIAEFANTANQLVIESEVIIQHYDEAPLDFLVTDYAQDYPFVYASEDFDLLIPYIANQSDLTSSKLAQWIDSFWKPGDSIQTFTLMQKLCKQIQQQLEYRWREEPGVQSAEETLNLQTGSCRDYANLFIQAARRLGLATRFVSGYLQTPPSTVGYGATHAWAEVFLPGAGWKGFDPTMGKVVGAGHIAVAVACLPESVPPVAGSFIGPAGSSLEVGVRVTELG